MRKYLKLSIVKFVILIILGIIAYSVLYYSSCQNVQIKVTDKEHITTGYGETISSKYIIYTEDEVFENTDEIYFGKFNSSDYQSALKVDSVYNVKVIGWRIPILSSYRNIIEINN